MRTDWQQLTMDQWRKFRREKPTLFMWCMAALAGLTYYIIILLPFDYAVENLKDSIEMDRTAATWMTKASQEILLLRQALPHQRIKTNSSTFTLINQSINDQGWNSIVTDVHQVEQNRVQVNFSAIAFNELVTWLEKLFDKYGIFVVEITLDKNQAGIVQATVVLQQTS